MGDALFERERLLSKDVRPWAGWGRVGPWGGAAESHQRIYAAPFPRHHRRRVASSWSGSTTTTTTTRKHKHVGVVGEEGQSSPTGRVKSRTSA